MRTALINPEWDYEHSIYFGCREPHLPLELGYAAARLRQAGHEVLLLDCQIQQLTTEQVAACAGAFAPDLTVVTTAPTYLFWRCAPPELKVPMRMLEALGEDAGLTVAVGPHGSVTPGSVLRKLGVDFVIRGECEEGIAALADDPSRRDIPGLAFLDEAGEVRMAGPAAAAVFTDAPALRWPRAWVQRHRHHHHRFDAAPDSPGAEVEASRGCPFSCSFCAKIEFRDRYRKRPLPVLLEEIDHLISQAVGYIYFIDEIFLPRADLLEALRERNVKFGIQTRIDLWQPEMLDLLGAAGCVSIEAGVESLTAEGRASLDKKCRLENDELAALLIRARKSVPFVQANLIKMEEDEAGLVAAWREALRKEDVWANDPVPLFPYPSAPEYRRLWGMPDDQAWERALAHYLRQFPNLSDLQESQPWPLHELERS